MSDFGDWHDPFADDEAARERERRRAEREASRRGAQESLADRVEEHSASADPPDSLDPALGAGGPPPDEPPPGPSAPPSSTPAAAIPASEEPATPIPPPPGGISPRDLLIRRIIGVAAVIALVAIVGIGFSKVIDALGGDDEPAGAGKQLRVEELLIPEGFDRRQIADLAKEAGLKGDYLEAAKKAPKGFPIDRYAPDGVPNLEGFLFPATYELKRNGTVDELIAKQLAAFRDNISRVDLSYAESKNLDVYDVLKIASMVEREIQVPEERKLAAAVIYNRLAAGDTLGIDATIRYEDQNYDEQLELSRLDEDTPYNTRVNPGLPPTPIGNPGLASIKAAANPAKSDAYYFVVKPCTEGEHVFVETEEEFLAAEAEYQEALQAQGGAPTDC